MSGRNPDNGCASFCKASAICDFQYCEKRLLHHTKRTDVIDRPVQPPLCPSGERYPLGRFRTRERSSVADRPDTF